MVSEYRRTVESEPNEQSIVALSLRLIDLEHSADDVGGERFIAVDFGTTQILKPSTDPLARRTVASVLRLRRTFRHLSATPSHDSFRQPGHCTDNVDFCASDAHRRPSQRRIDQSHRRGGARLHQRLYNARYGQSTQETAALPVERKCQRERIGSRRRGGRAGRRHGTAVPTIAHDRYRLDSRSLSGRWRIWTSNVSAATPPRSFPAF